MTKRGIERLIEDLRPVMRLERWKIEASFPETMSEGVLAEVNRLGDYFEATLRIAPAHKTWSKTKAREVLAHELAHLIFSDIDAYVDRLHKQRLSPHEQEYANGNYDSLVEAAVDWVGVIVSDGIAW